MKLTIEGLEDRAAWEDGSGAVRTTLVKYLG